MSDNGMPNNDELTERIGYANGLKAAAQVANLWASSHSCDAHDSDPCCHVRTGVSIEERIRALIPESEQATPSDSEWVTFGRIKVDVENETQTFERIYPPESISTPAEKE